MRWLCAPPRILRTCWTACIGMMSVHFGRVMHSQPVVGVLGEWGLGPVQIRGWTWRRAHESSGRGKKTRRVRSKNCLRLRATFNRRGKECRDGERFEEFAATLRVEFYWRRRLGATVAAMLRIPKGTTCPVTRLQNPP